MACLLYGGSVAGWKYSDPDYSSALFVNLSFFHATVYNAKTTNTTKIWGKKVQTVIDSRMLDDEYKSLIPQMELNESNNSGKGGYNAKYIAHPPITTKPYDADKEDEATDIIKSCLKYIFPVKDDEITDSGLKMIKDWIASDKGALACYLMVYFRLIDKTPKSFIQSSLREPFSKMMSVLNIRHVDIRDKEPAITTMQALVQKRSAQIIMMTLAVEEAKTDAVNSIKQLYSLRLAFSSQQCIKVLMAAAKSGFSPKLILSALSHKDNHKTCQKMLAAYLIYATPCEGCF